MFDYEEFCPVSKTATIIGERWTIQIVREMHFGATRFSDFQRYLPKISPSLLAARLQSLEDNRILIKRRITGKRGYEYQLTPAGKALLPTILEMGKWGIRYVYDSLSDNELHSARLMRDISLTIDVSALPAGDTIIRFDFKDLQEHSCWSISVHDGKAELCEGAPQSEVDVTFTTTLGVFTKVWMGSTDLHSAMARGELRITGAPVYTKRLMRWLRLNQFAPFNPNFKAG